jgi:hypothetical protein
VSAPQRVGGSACQQRLRTILGEDAYRVRQIALARAGGIARQSQLRHALGEDGYRAHQRALYQRAVEKYGAAKMQAILTAAHEQRRCWRLANPTTAEELLHWRALEAGVTLHIDLSGTWEWTRYQAEPGHWQFGPSDALIEARVGPYACDLLFPAHALVIEVIGGVHRLTAERDAIRTETLAAQGLAVVTFTNAQVCRCGRPAREAVAGGAPCGLIWRRTLSLP